MNIKTIEGGFLVPEDSHIGRWQIECQNLAHDNFLPRLACEFIKEGDTVVDCGALCGDHTIVYSDKVGSGHVLAIEPGELAFECLAHNVKLFKNKNVTVANCALSNTDSFADFIQGTNLGGSICKENADGNTQTFRLDTLYNIYPMQLSDFHFVKIDCEGWERRILEGARGLIAKFKPSMMIEMNFYALQAQNSSYGEIFDLLNKWGYEWAIAQPECTISDPQWDLIAWHPSKKTYDHKEFLAKNR